MCKYHRETRFPTMIETKSVVSDYFLSVQQSKRFSKIIQYGLRNNNSSEHYSIPAKKYWKGWKVIFSW